MNNNERRAAFKQGFMQELNRQGITPDKLLDGVIMKQASGVGAMLSLDAAKDAISEVAPLVGFGARGALGIGLALPAIGGLAAGAGLYHLSNDDAMEQKKYEVESQMQAYRLAAKKLLDSNRRAKQGL